MGKRKRQVTREPEPEAGQLYRTHRAFRFLVKRPTGLPLSFVVRKDTVFMLVDKGRSLGMKGYNYRRCWLTEDGRDDPYDVGGTVFVYTILHDGRTWEVGFRDRDWGNELRPFKPRRSNRV